MVQHIEILKQIIENLVHEVQVKSVDNSSGTESVLSVCNTYYLNACDKFITIDGIEYEITDFTINSSLTLVPQDDAATLVDPATTDFIIPAPRFYSGTPKATSEEKTADEANGGDNDELVQGPIVWILEVLDILPPEDINKSVVRSTMSGVNIFFLDDTRYQDWNTEDHRTNVINPQKNEWEFVFKGFDKLVGEFFGELEKGRIREHADFGKYIIDKGYKGTILTERLSGIQVTWDIPFSFDPCDDCDNGPIEICQPVETIINGVSMGFTANGMTKIITVQDDDELPTGSKIDDNTWGVGATSGPIGYVRPSVSYTISYDLYDEGWQFINNSDTYIVPPTAILAKLEKGNPLKLVEDNAFGNKFRYTGYLGGYVDPSDGFTYDKDGVLSDFTTEFQKGAVVQDEYIIDHFTGLGWRARRGGQVNYSTALANAQALTSAGFTDWFIPTKQQMQSLFHEDNVTFPTHVLPFQLFLTPWTCTPYHSAPTTGVFYPSGTSGGPGWSNRSKGNLLIQWYVRYHYT